MTPAENLRAAAAALAEARVGWAEAFLRYRFSDRSATDNQARAKADVEWQERLTTAEIEHEIALRTPEESFGVQLIRQVLKWRDEGKISRSTAMVLVGIDPAEVLSDAANNRFEPASTTEAEDAAGA